MIGYVFLGIAIIGEVIATTFLKFTTGEDSKWWAWAIVVVGYLLSFGMLQQALTRGIPLGVAYAIWCAVGIVAVAIISFIVFKDSITTPQLIGFALVVIGVALIELGAKHSATVPLD